MLVDATAALHPLFVSVLRGTKSRQMNGRKQRIFQRDLIHS
jgi:hypothetical protein